MLARFPDRLPGRSAYHSGLVTVVLALVFAVCLVTGSALAVKQTVTLRFDELSSRPANGVSLNGVTFSYDIGGAPSADATYNAFGPGSTRFVQDPSLEGSTSGRLTLAFDRPTGSLDFGLALSTFGSVTPGASVQLFNPGGHSRGVIPLNTSSSSSFAFSDGRFEYSGGAIGSAVITFNSTAAARFALDNLSFEQRGVPRSRAFSASGARWSPGRRR
jgi:hypothetical protein